MKRNISSYCFLVVFWSLIILKFAASSLSFKDFLKEHDLLTQTNDQTNISNLKFSILTTQHNAHPMCDPCDMDFLPCSMHWNLYSATSLTLRHAWIGKTNFHLTELNNMRQIHHGKYLPTVIGPVIFKHVMLYSGPRYI